MSTAKKPFVRNPPIPDLSGPLREEFRRHALVSSPGFAGGLSIPLDQLSLRQRAAERFKTVGAASDMV